MATAEMLEPTVADEPAPAETERRVWTALDVIERFGPIPMSRLRHNVDWGTATEEDVLRLEGSRDKSLCELIEGVLLAKTVGAYESAVAGVMFATIFAHVRARRLGTVLMADGFTRFRPDKVYIPDVCFIPSERLPPEGLQPSTPFRHSSRHWPWRCSADPTRGAKWRPSCRTTSRAACWRCGSSTRPRSRSASTMVRNRSVP